MFLAHFSGWAYETIVQWDDEEIARWFLAALDLHTEMNTVKDKK